MTYLANPQPPPPREQIRKDVRRMNFYQFMKGIQTGVGDDCRVRVSLFSFTGYVNGLEITIDWPNDFHYRFVLLEQHIDNAGFLEHFQEYTIHNANRAFRIAEVGE